MTPAPRVPHRWRIDATGPLEPDLILRMLANHAIPGVEVAEPEQARHTRLIVTRHGLSRVALTIDGTSVTVELDDHEVRSEVDARVRRWLDLEADLGAVHDVLGADPVVAPLIATRPGLRVLEYPDPFEAAIVTVLGQQVSVAAARTFAGRLVAAYGTTHPSGLVAFPTPEQIIETDHESLRAAIGITNARARTVRVVARAFLGRDGAALDRDELLALPGVGPWTADYLDVRSRGDRDGFPSGDLVLRQALGLIPARAAVARAEVWRPFRAYALFHLWVAAAYGG